LERSIVIRGARTHNLRNISLDLPRGKLTVVTGVSGSGKSSLVFDTLYAEGQRRYVQSLSAYARMFLERLERPDVDYIGEIPPALALRQKNTITNARSTVGTVTEIADYMRLLYATLGVTVCPHCGTPVTRDTVEGASARIVAEPGAYVFVAPFDAAGRGQAQAATYLIQNGYHRIFADDRFVETAELASGTVPNIDGPIPVVVDRIQTTKDNNERAREALEKAFHLGGGRVRVIKIERREAGFQSVGEMVFDRRFNCSRCATEFPEPTASLFSFNSPLGACSRCEGFGRIVELDLEKVIPNPALSLRQGLIAPWRTPAYREVNEWMLKCARQAKVRRSVPFHMMTDEERAWLLDGERSDDEPATDEHPHDRWPGVRGFFRWLEGKRYKTHVRVMLARYRRFVTCPDCGGTRLKPAALNVLIGSRTIADVSRMPVRELGGWLDQIARDETAQRLARPIFRELSKRVRYLNEVGLGYLTLARQARTLSGGEAQRIHLASALGNLLVGALYVLDEPTVGLHARDARQLLAVLQELRDHGNTVVVVEHDHTIIAGADNVVELGPGGGRQGGNVIYDGPSAPGVLSSAPKSPARSMLMRLLAREKRFGRSDPAIRILGARANNLRNINVAIPLRRLVAVTGVSGSGKSSLVEDVLYHNWLRSRGEPVSDVGECGQITGFDALSEIVHMGQELPARSSRSNLATYVKFYDEIRSLFGASPEARRMGIGPRAFSFNVAGGRCERCGGTGIVTIEMHFMADLEVTCDQCEGRRFQKHVLAVKLDGRNINDVLALTVDEAIGCFQRRPTLVSRLRALAAVGLGYLQLGQTTSTLSGGEAQRLKLARFLLADLEPAPVSSDGARRGRLFILDEPTTGLSSLDVRRLMHVLDHLVREGNSVLVIEHNLELIAQSDYVIDLGPGGGEEGGRVIACGTPLAVARSARSHTGCELRQMLHLPSPTPSARIRRRVGSIMRGSTA
jgi:excinuclease ABC subunit A